jgi:class 3 adenylate cyclase/pimeloyl-ACP methyl ester carboxylesterase
VDPRIQYAQTSDGAGIAFWQLGEGPTVIQMPSIPFSHIQMEWADPDWRAWYELLGVDLTVIRYDPRGCGLSSPTPGDLSLDAMVEDLRAVASRAGCERFALLAPVQAAPTAVAFAARFPAAVSHLILWCGISRGDELRTSSFEALRTLSRTDWGLFAEAAAHALVAGWDQAEAAHRLAAIMRESSSADIHEAVMECYLAADITAELAAVACPTLVAYRSQGTAPLPASARYLAAAIRESTLLPFPGSSLLFVGLGAEEVAGAFRGFLQVQRRDHGGPAQSGFQTLLYTDIEGHSAIIQKLGDDRGRAVLREHERITRELIASHNGVEVLATGDGFLVRFSTAQAALECSANLQQSLADAAADLPVELRVRIGINAGEPILEGAELHGASVLNAERIAGQADGGEILVANVVRELAAGKNFAFADRGSATLPGLDEPIRLWELLWAHTAT